MTLGMKIFNKKMFDTFQGYADQGQVFEDDARYTFRKEFKFPNGKVGPFLVTGNMIYQALNNSPSNDRFGSIDTSEQYFTDTMVLNLIDTRY